MLCGHDKKEDDLKLDYDIKDIDGRKAVVDDILKSGEALSQKQLGYMADYLLFVADSKQTGREKRSEYPIVTKNRDVTVSKRQVSFEDTVASLSNGEDGLYGLISDSDVALLDNRAPITQDDIDTIPGIKENLETIDSLKRQFDSAEGPRKYSLKQQIISKYQEMYSAKSSYLGARSRAYINAQIKSMAHMPLDEYVEIGDDGYPRATGAISLLRADHIAFLLKYYSKLKGESWDDLQSDMHFLLMDLEDLVDRALLPDYEVLYDLLVLEIDGLNGQEIVREMERRYGIVHSEQYFSTLWCKKIPKLIAEQAQKDYLVWYYTYKATDDAQWKICKTCGKKQLAHPLFFHKNTSKDGYYSKCRRCRSKKGKVNAAQ